MAERMTHGEYVSGVRSQIVEIAHRLLNEKLSFLEGARQICSLRKDAEVPERDGDFDAFTVIESETDALPIGSVRQHWSEMALKDLEPEIEKAERWAREIGTGACHALIHRFRV